MSAGADSPEVLSAFEQTLDARVAAVEQGVARLNRIQEPIGDLIDAASRLNAAMGTPQTFQEDRLREQVLGMLRAIREFCTVPEWTPSSSPPSSDPPPAS